VTAQQYEDVVAERDAAYAALMQILGIPGDDWRIEDWPEEYEGWSASLHRTCICDNDKRCWCCDPDNLTAPAAAAIRAAAVTQATQGDKT
jgi:hypothetical protein